MSMTIPTNEIRTTGEQLTAIAEKMLKLVAQAEAISAAISRCYMQGGVGNRAGAAASRMRVASLNLSQKGINLRSAAGIYEKTEEELVLQGSVVADSIKSGRSVAWETLPAIQAVCFVPAKIATELSAALKSESSAPPSSKTDRTPPGWASQDAEKKTLYQEKDISDRCELPIDKMARTKTESNNAWEKETHTTWTTKAATTFISTNNEQVEKGTVRFIRQEPKSKLFVSDYWDECPSNVNPSKECGTSSISMALSYLGYDYTPEKLFKLWDRGKTTLPGEVPDGVTVIKGSKINTFSKLYDQYLEGLRTGENNYSPIIIQVKDGTKNSTHFVIVTDRVLGTKDQYTIVDPGSDKVTRTITIRDNEKGTFYLEYSNGKKTWKEEHKNDGLWKMWQYSTQSNN